MTNVMMSDLTTKAVNKIGYKTISVFERLSNPYYGSKQAALATNLSDDEVNDRLNMLNRRLRYKFEAKTISVNARFLKKCVAGELTDDFSRLAFSKICADLGDDSAYVISSVAKVGMSVTIVD